VRRQLLELGGPRLEALPNQGLMSQRESERIHSSEIPCGTGRLPYQNHLFWYSVEPELP
jgi:hypothetical protein